MKVLAELILNIQKFWNLTCKKWRFRKFQKSADFQKIGNHFLSEKEFYIINKLSDDVI